MTEEEAHEALLEEYRERFRIIAPWASPSEIEALIAEALKEPFHS